MFSCEFCDVFRNTFFTEHLWATASSFSVETCISLDKNVLDDTFPTKYEDFPHFSSVNLEVEITLKNETSQSEAITAQKIKFSIKDFFSKCDQIRRKVEIWSHLLKKSLMENFIFCAVNIL